MVVLVQGQDCCNDVAIVSIVNRRSELVVTALSPSSPENKTCALPDFSVHVARLPRFDIPVRFVVNRSEKLC